MNNLQSGREREKERERERERQRETERQTERYNWDRRGREREREREICTMASNTFVGVDLWRHSQGVRPAAGLRAVLKFDYTTS